jgi:hypothetical protein
MVFTTIGYNLTKLSTMSPLNLSIETTSSQILNKFSYYPDYLTQGLYAYISLMIIFLVLYFLISKPEQENGIGYNFLNSLAISFGITAIFGLTELEIGMIYNFKAVALFVVLFMISLILIAIDENKE